MLLKTVTNENYFAAEFIQVARNMIAQGGNSFSQKDLENFLSLPLSDNINKALYNFNYLYFSFPHNKRIGMYSEFDNYSEKIIANLINEFEKIRPTQDKNLKIIYSLTCCKILDMIKKDLELLGDKELIELLDIEDLKIINWSKE